MPKTVTIFGGSGFIGRYIVRRMARRGWRVRVAVRRPNEAMYLLPNGSPGQIEPMICNIRNHQSVEAVIAGADAVVNCVGLLNEIGSNEFGAVHEAGALAIAEAATRHGVSRLVHISAIGASSSAACKYSRSKARGEEFVRKAFPSAVILRPSVVFGPEDEFFNKFAKMARFGPIIPLVGANTKLQPVHVDDLAGAAEIAITRKSISGVFELGGPEVLTMRQLVQKTLDVIGRRKAILGMPFWMGTVIASALDAMQAITLGLLTNSVLTRDQVKSLRADNVVSDTAKSFEVFGIKPRELSGVLPEYLWVYRPSGEFSAIKKSARNLKGNT